jgi:hypothetical protein
MTILKLTRRPHLISFRTTTLKLSSNQHSVHTISMTLSTPMKTIVACFAVAALVSTAMSGKVSAGVTPNPGLKGSARKLQLRRTKIIKKRNNSVITKTRDGPQLDSPELDSPKIIKKGTTSLIIKTEDGVIIKTGDDTASASIVVQNAGKAGIFGLGFFTFFNP